MEKFIRESGNVHLNERMNIEQILSMLSIKANWKSGASPKCGEWQIQRSSRQCRKEMQETCGDQNRHQPLRTSGADGFVLPATMSGLATSIVFPGSAHAFAGVFDAISKLRLVMWAASFRYTPAPCILTIDNNTQDMHEFCLFASAWSSPG